VSKCSHPADHARRASASIEWCSVCGAIRPQGGVWVLTEREVLKND